MLPVACILDGRICNSFSLLNEVLYAKSAELLHSNAAAMDTNHTSLHILQLSLNSPWDNASWILTKCCPQRRWFKKLAISIPLENCTLSISLAQASFSQSFQMLKFSQRPLINLNSMTRLMWQKYSSFKDAWKRKMLCTQQQLYYLTMASGMSTVSSSNSSLGFFFHRTQLWRNNV